jgi:hypothetical protein
MPRSYHDRKNIITTQSVFCMLPAQINNNYSCFPTQPIKKQNPDGSFTKFVKSNENEDPKIRYETD